MKNTILISSLVILLGIATFLLIKIWIDGNNLSKANSALNKELMQSKLEIGRAHTEFGNANKHIKELEGELQKEIKDRNARITRIGQLEAQLITKGTLKPSQGGNFADSRIETNISLEDCPKLGEIKYTLRLRLEGQLVETITPSGAINHYINIWEIDEKNKKLQKLELTNFNMIIEDQRKSRFFWWAPHLDVGLSVTYALSMAPKYGASIGFTPSGYGLTNNDLSYRFLRVSFEAQKDLGIGFQPVLWNAGTVIPLLSNLWIAPSFIFHPATNDKSFGLVIGAVL